MDSKIRTNVDGAGAGEEADSHTHRDFEVTIGLLARFSNLYIPAKYKTPETNGCLGVKGGESCGAAK